MTKVNQNCYTAVKGAVSLTQDTIDQITAGMNLGIELGTTQVGCIKDVAGNITGSVYLVIEKAENGLTTTTVLKAVDYTTGTIIDPFIGTVSNCEPATVPVPASLQPVALEELCVKVDGIAQAAVPVMLYNAATGLHVSTSYVNDLGQPIVGAITPASPCDCPCTDCPDILACQQMLAWDYVAQASLTPGSTQSFRIWENGVLLTTVIHDYLTTTDNVNKSSWYAPIVAAINAVPGWNISVIADVPVGNNGRVLWKLEYSGTAGSTLLIDGSGADYRQMAVTAAGVVTTDTGNSGASFPFGTPAFSNCI